jgi:hypothetical protein
MSCMQTCDPSLDTAAGTPHSDCSQVLAGPPEATAHLHTRPAAQGAEAEPEIHRVDPEFGSTLRLLKGFPVKLLGQLANFGSTL